MMKQILFMSVVMMLAGAEAFACTRDARICKDGTSRGRDPRRNCEFWPPCPEDRRAKKENAPQNLLCANLTSPAAIKVTK